MIRRINPLLLLLLLLSPLIISVGAQPSPPGNNENNQYNYPKFSPAMAIIIVVLIATLFLMGFFSIYIRHCSDTSAGGSLRRALSLRGRHDPGARGLDAAAIATFPTFTYSEVKDHKIGKGALECAVCLNEFEGDETLRLIPKCDHVFHPECIDTWLQSHVTCPVCRTNLVPQPGDDIPLPEPDADNNIITDRIEIVIQVEEGEPDRFPASDYPNRPPRSWSVRSTKVPGLGKFRSHSTGHSLVQPGENLDRFTLKLPNEMRKEMMERVVLNRSGSNTVTLPRERSLRRGFRTGGGEGSNRTARFNREAKSDRWVFFSRSTKVVAEAGESSGSSGPPLKLPSFNCLEPKTDDEIGLMAENRSKPSV